MKYIKKDFNRKLIIILILLLLFNTFYPSMSYALDVGGILMQPIYWLILGTILPTDIFWGSILRLSNFTLGDKGNEVDEIMTELKNGDTSGILDRVFVGPDTIFKRRHCVL